MATNVNISVPTFTDGEGNLLTLDKAIRAAVRTSLQSKERTPKIEKDARSQASGAKESGNIKMEPRRDPGAVRRKKEQPLTAGSGASNQTEEDQDGGGAGDPSLGIPYIVISNVNSAKDDNFDIYLNGTQLSGRANFSIDNEITTYLYYWDSAYASNIRSFYSSYYFRDSYLQGGPRPNFGGAANTIFLQNVGQNNNGNYGLIYFGIYNPGNNLNAAVQDTWGPDDGDSQTFSGIIWPPVP